MSVTVFITASRPQFTSQGATVLHGWPSGMGNGPPLSKSGLRPPRSWEAITFYNMPKIMESVIFTGYLVSSKLIRFRGTGWPQIWPPRPIDVAEVAEAKNYIISRFLKGIFINWKLPSNLGLRGLDDLKSDLWGQFRSLRSLRPKIMTSNPAFKVNYLHRHFSSRLLGVSGVLLKLWLANISGQT